MGENIIGNQNPVVGIIYTYEFNLLSLLGSLGSDFEWHIFKKQKTGRWKDITNTPKKGSKVTYQFGEIALGIEFEMKVYEIKQGLLSEMGLSKNLIGTFSVVPIRNKVSKINRVTLFNRGAKDINKANYRDVLVAEAHCIAMFNEEIEFQLWEDDAKGEGHNTEINKNNRSPKIYKARVNEKGIAEVRIPLMSDEKVLRQIANKYMMRGDQNEGANHEYYVTASHAGKIQVASPTNVDIANPDYKKERPNPQPQKDTPKFPENPRHNKQPDPKGNIIEAVFINNEGKELSKITVGEALRVRIHSKNMVGKHIQYVIWEKDATSHDEIYRSKMIKIPADVCDTYAIILSKDLFKKGIDLPISDPDADKQNYFIEIISKDLSAESVKFGVDTENGILEVERVRSPVIIKETKREENPTTTKCPRCEKLTEEEVDKLFTTASKANKEALIEAFNDANNKFEINSCLRKAHFFAQVLAEVGTNLKLNEPESFNYSVRRLKGGDYIKGSNWVRGNGNPTEGGYYSKGNNKDWKSSPFSYFKKKHKEAELYGRKDLNAYNDKGLQVANSIAIANLVYDDKNRDPKYKIGNIYEGDGWKFMGKGIIQITGRTNYTEVNKRLIKKGFNFDIVVNPQIVLKHKESVLSAMAFWYWKDLQLKSKGGKEIVDNITKIVNEATDTYNHRKENFDKTYSVFQVEKCSPIEKNEIITTGKWRFPIDNPMLCLYSQGGVEKPWHGSFGEKIRDRTANHAGSDLLAIPGTPVYACLDGKIDRVYTSTSLAGRVIVVKVTDKVTFKSLKNNYNPIYKNKGELAEKGFNPNGEIYLVFMHLSKFGTFKEGESVKYNDVIGYTGVSGKNGNNFETKNPHLHFEVNNVGSKAGIQGKCNPMVYFKFKTEFEMLSVDKKLQLDIKNKVWK